MRKFLRIFPILDFRKLYYGSLTYWKFDEREINGAFAGFVAPNELTNEYTFEDKRKQKSTPKPQENVLEFLVKNFFWEGDTNPLMVFGDFGVGKTTFLQKLFVCVAQQYPKQAMTFVYCGKDTDEQLRTISDKGNIILFLDGFDEDEKLKQDNYAHSYYGVENDSQRQEDLTKSRIVELNQILSKFYKVVISSRPSAFSANEVSWLRIGNKDFSVLTLNGFNEKNAEKYLTKKFALDFSKQFQSFFLKTKPKNTNKEKALNLFRAKPEFFKKPLLLSFFDYLLGLDIAKVKEIYLYQIYEVLIKECAIREAKIVEGSNPSQTSYDNEIIQNAKLFCYKMYDAAQDILTNQITAKELSQKWLANFDKAQKHNKQNRSFLKREGDMWSFTHQSLRDYFVAMLLFEQSIKVKNSDTGKENTLYLYEENPQTGKKTVLLRNHPEIINFYKEMLWHKIAQRQKPIALPTPLDKNWQIESYLFTPDFRHFNDLRLEEAKYTFKVVEKLKEFGIKHYFIGYYDQYQECLDTFSMFIERNYWVELFLQEIYLLLDEKLKLKHNYLLEEYKDIWEFKGLRELCELKLSNLPTEIGQLQNLKVLWLDRNQLTELPPQIGQLQNLKVLCLDRNQLTELPPQIGQLQNLEELCLHRTQLTELPPQIGQLQKLKILDLDENRLTELPPQIGQLQNLEKLWLDRNQLTKLPPQIGQLQNLKILRLDENRLTELPESIGKLQKLQKLNLVNNNFSEPEKEKIRQLLPNCEVYF